MHPPVLTATTRTPSNRCVMNGNLLAAVRHQVPLTCAKCHNTIFEEYKTVFTVPVFLRKTMWTWPNGCIAP